MKQKIYDALYQRYKAQKEEARVEIWLYFETTVGVADHPNLIDTIDGLVKKYNEADERLGGLEKLIWEEGEDK
tara:strand:+ start:173 stop:391 length:219 start_codon:yes stop_codon:yes gene_type:complete